MTTIRLKGGRIVDPANGVDGQVRDIGIRDGRIVALHPEDKVDTEYDLALKAYRRVKTRKALLGHMRNYVAALEAQLAAVQNARPDPRDIRSRFQQERRVASELAQAREMAGKLGALPHYDANLYHRIGRCFFNTDRYWEARTAFTRVVAIAQDDTVREAGHFDLILAISRLRRFDDLVIEADHYLSTYDPQGKWE